MSELLEFAFSGANLIPTVLLIFVIIYWGIVIVGVIDIDSIDIDLDVDLDADVDVEIGGLASVLSFFNIGHMPLMVFITFFSLPLWTLTLIINDLLGFHSFLLQLMIFLPVAFGSLFIAKILTIPIARFYRRVKQNTEAVENLVGRVCTAKLRITSSRKGQVEIKSNGTSVLISALTRADDVVEKGDTALIIDQATDSNHYYIEPYNV